MKDNPLTWSEVEMNNCYDLYLATNLWELEDSITLTEFKVRITEDPIFRQSNHLLVGMDKETYNPWKSNR